MRNMKTDDRPSTAQCAVRRDRSLLLFAALIAVMLGMAMIWYLLPEGSRTFSAGILSFGKTLPPLICFAAIIGIYTVAGFVSFPIAVLMPVTGMLFGPFPGIWYSILGLLANASALYLAGCCMERVSSRLLAGEKTAALITRLSKRSLLTIITLRLLPVAPFSVVNVAAGAIKIPFSVYVFGTLIGILPAAVVMTSAGSGLTGIVRPYAAHNVMYALAAGIVLLAVLCFLALLSLIHI